MDLSAIVEVAIGIVFVWITLSLATIQIQEWINQIANKRALDLKATIRTMLVDPDLAKSFYDHPIIKGLRAKEGKLPSYIPSQQFALTLFDLAMDAGTRPSPVVVGLQNIQKEFDKITNGPMKHAAIVVSKELTELAQLPELATGITNAGYDAIIDKLTELSAQYGRRIPTIDLVLNEAKKQKSELDDFLINDIGGKAIDPALIQLRRGIAVLSGENPELHRTVTALVRNVENYVSEKESQLGLARRNVEQWFDDSMDQLSGDFKRYSQWWAFVIGLALALFLNIDSINLSIHLWRDPTVRQILVANAEALHLPEESLAEDPEQAMQDIRQQLVGLNLPIGWVISTSEGDLTAFWDNECQLFPAVGQSFGIPIAIPFRDMDKRCLAPPQSNNQMNIALKLFGILFTAIATAQGAPFWFDILKKLVNLRGTGANPVEKETVK